MILEKEMILFIITQQQFFNLFTLKKKVDVKFKNQLILNIWILDHSFFYCNPYQLCF